MIFEDIQAFVNVARYGGFGRAANSMSIAQSALSKRVNQRRVLTRRAQDVARLYAPTPDAQVIVIT